MSKPRFTKSVLRGLATLKAGACSGGGGPEDLGLPDTADGRKRWREVEKALAWIDGMVAYKAESVAPGEREGR